MNKLILTLLAVGFCAVACAKNNTYQVDDSGLVTMGDTKNSQKRGNFCELDKVKRDMTETDKPNFFARLGYTRR